MRRARQLYGANRPDRALKAYERVVEMQDARLELPAVALRHIATLHLAEDRPRAAADAMDRLSQRAIELGRPTDAANALLEAAILYQQAGRGDIARQRVEQLQRLLTSPHVPEAQRTGILARIVG